MMQDKYWIDPQGNLAEVDQRHIITIMEKPEAFGLTKKYIDATHKKYKERPGSEGNAREAILTRLMDMGWIRLRYVQRDDAWGIQISETSDVPYRRRIRDWARFVLKNSRTAEYSRIKIINLVPALVEPEYSLGEVAAGALEEKRKRGTFADFLNPAYRTVKRRGIPRKAIPFSRKFKPSGSMFQVGRRHNPVKWETDKTISANLMVGFSVGGKAVWTMPQVVRMVRTWLRNYSFKGEDGKRYLANEDGSFYYQRGVYTHHDSGRVIEEFSTMIHLINQNEKQTGGRFTGMITRLAQYLADTMRQDEIICELLNNNTIVRTWGVTRRSR